MPRRRLRQGRPDLQQAIGELYETSGQADCAGDWYRKALGGYLRSTQRSEVHFYHHLADYYADVAKDGAAAIVWARADLRRGRISPLRRRSPGRFTETASSTRHATGSIAL